VNAKAAKQAKLFNTGGSQAVRLPAEYRFAGDAVFVRRDAATGGYATFMATRAAQGEVPADFLSEAERRQGHETRDPFADGNA
jgi:antitoxin VapB